MSENSLKYATDKSIQRALLLLADLDFDRQAAIELIKSVHGIAEPVYQHVSCRINRRHAVNQILSTTQPPAPGPATPAAPDELPDRF